LHGELVKITQQPETRKRMAGQGTDVIGSTPEEFRKVIQVESAKWANVIKTAGIKPE
jgi:tripartite-type tricarboxylate transporter receptor subunit TctC